MNKKFVFLDISQGVSKSMHFSTSVWTLYCNILEKTNVFHTNIFFISWKNKNELQNYSLVFFLFLFLAILMIDQKYICWIKRCKNIWHHFHKRTIFESIWRKNPSKERLAIVSTKNGVLFCIWHWWQYTLVIAIEFLFMKIIHH